MGVREGVEVGCGVGDSLGVGVAESVGEAWRGIALDIGDDGRVDSVVTAVEGVGGEEGALEGVADGWCVGDSLCVGVAENVGEAAIGEEEGVVLGVKGTASVGSGVAVARGNGINDACSCGRESGAGSDGPIEDSIIAVVVEGAADL
jgi:hypothetical protein